MVSYVPATMAMLEAFLGYRPQQTIKAWVVRKDKPVAIMGFTFGKIITVFSDYKGGLTPREILAAGRFLMGNATQYPAVYAIGEYEGTLLKHLGFKHLEGETYIWDN